MAIKGDRFVYENEQSKLMPSYLIVNVQELFLSECRGRYIFSADLARIISWGKEITNN